MTTKNAMQKTGLRYFSSLSPRQKDLATNITIGCKFNDFNPVLLPIYKQIFNPDLSGCKMFYFEKMKVWLPVNVKEIIS